MSLDEALSLIPQSEEVNLEAFTGTAEIVGRERVNFSLGLPRLHLDVVMALAAIDSEGQEQVTLGTEVRAAILYYANMRRQQPGFSEAMDRAKARLEALLPKVGDVAVEYEAKLGDLAGQSPQEPSFPAAESLRRVAEANQSLFLQPPNLPRP